MLGARKSNKRSWLSREDQLAAFAKVKQFQVMGWGASEIARAMHCVSYPTVIIWMGRTKPPGARGKSGLQFGPTVRASVGTPIAFASRAAVPSQLAEIRDNLCQAFLAGNLDYHAHLCQELKKRLNRLKGNAPVLLSRAEPAQIAAE